MISNHALKKVRLSLSTWQLLLVSTRWQINLSPENKLLKQHNLGQFGCSSLVKKFGRNCLTYLINYQDSTKVWEIPQTLCVVGMTTYYGINFKNSKSVKIFQDMHCACHLFTHINTQCCQFNLLKIAKKSIKKISVNTVFDRICYQGC